MRRSWLALGAGVPVVIAGALLVRHTLRAEGPHAPSIAKLSGPAAAAAAIAPPPPTLHGIDLAKLEVKEDRVTTALPDKKVAKLTVDPVLQKTAHAIMNMHHLPEAAIVLMDVETGKILVYASHIEKGPPRDLCVEATAPAASVFKIVTGSALVETAGLTPEQKECYSGGEHSLVERDLVRDPKRDRWCTTLSGAMGRSINTVFARLASERLKPAELNATAHTLGFGSSLPFDVAVQPSSIRLPDDQLGYARTAAGFWNTTLSPIHATWLSAAIARGGEPVRPVVVAEVDESNGKATWVAPMGLAQKRVMKAETAEAVTTMMDATVSDGTSYRAFHDNRGRAFLPGIAVAGKTGTLTDAVNQRFYTWFTGFAPSRPYTLPEGKDGTPPRQVAFAALVVNDPKWSIKANVLAREVLRAYFAEQKVPSVTMPITSPPKVANAKK